MGRQTSKQYSVVFLVEGKKFKVRNLLLRTSSLFCSAANSVGTLLEFAAFGSGPDAKYSRPSAFWVSSVPKHGFYGGPNTFSQENYPRVYRSICDR